ncbi:MAG: hypothetical protein ACR5KV_01605 [Wolbachia sp.]
MMLSAEVVIDVLESKINEEYVAFEKNHKDGDLSSEEIKINCHTL